MESLSLEIVEMIVPHLSAIDLAACCATSHSWREIFNQDLFWKHLCKEATSIYLSKTPCRVKPAFISPEVEGSGLDPVCQWRMNYMRENHLLNNWRSGKFHSEPIFSNGYLQGGYRGKMLLYQEEFLICLSHSGLEVLIWDLRWDAVSYVDKPCLFLPGITVNKMFLCGDNLVVMQGALVLVFQINLMQKVWPLGPSFFFDDGPSDFTSAIRAYNLEGELPFTYYSLMLGSHLLVISSRLGTFTWNLHLWDIVQGSKLKEEVIEERENTIISGIEPSTTSLDDIIVYLKDLQCTKVLVYSLINFNYYPCVFESAEYSDLQGDKIVVNIKIPSDYWLIANYKTGEQIFRFEDLGCSPYRNIEVFDNKLIYIANGGLNQINLDTGEIKQFLDARSDVYDFQLLGDKLVHISVFRREEDIFSLLISDQEIWETCVSKRFVAVSNYLLDSLAVKTNTPLTKMIDIQSEDGTDYTVNAISFW